MRTQANFVVRLLSAMDAIFLALVLAAVAKPMHAGRPMLVLALLLVPYWNVLLRYFGIYESHRMESVSGLVRKIVSAQVTGIITTGLALLLLKQQGHWRELLLFVEIGTVALIASRAGLYLPLHVLRKRGFDNRNVCVIGSWESARETAERYRTTSVWGLRVSCVGIGNVGNRSYVRFPDGAQLSTSLEDLLRKEVVDEVLIDVAPEDLPRETDTVQLCSRYGVVGRVVLNTSSSELAEHQLEVFTGATTITVGKVPGDGPSAIWKRAMDIVLGSLFLLALSPILIISALLVKLSSSGPVIFRQRRAGTHGRPFVMYKFRTMVDGAESMRHALVQRSIAGGPIFKDRVDMRITPIGRFLRRFSIDELPQLINVVLGDMSLVGPRPLPLTEAEHILGIHRRRFSMRPGITCVWQVNGRSDVEFSQWMSYDLQYVDDWSLWLDTKLLLQTIPAVLTGKGAY